MSLTNAPEVSAFDNLVQLAVALRPTWQAPGIKAAIKAALGRDEAFTFAELAYVVVATAQDATQRTPAPIGHPDNPNWRKSAPSGHAAGMETDQREVCSICSLTRDGCTWRSRTNGHEFLSVADYLRSVKVAADDKRNSIGPADEAANLCPHHINRNRAACRECERAETSEEIA